MRHMPLDDQDLPDLSLDQEPDERDLRDAEDVPALGADEPPPAAPWYDEQKPNLVRDFMLNPNGPDALKEVADKVCRDKDSAWDSTEKYRKKMANNWKLLIGDLPPK